MSARESSLAVEMRGITKRFPGVLANDKVDFQLAKGEVHALLGENGAGKSTLMNVLYGLYEADEGEIWVRGRLARIGSPKDAIDLGITMVHQQFELVETLTVSENVALGLKVKREPLLNLEAVSARIDELSKKYGLASSPAARVGQLSVGEKQRVEILKALYRGTEILILDEPSSVLTPQETAELFRFLRFMAQEGRSVVFITHKLNEVIEVSDRVTVLRKGRVVGTVPTGQTNVNLLATMMVGREVGLEDGSAPSPGKGALLEMRDVRARGSQGTLALNGLTLTVEAGEILGLAGVAGNGQNQLVDVLLGIRRIEGGSMTFRGADISHSSPAELIRMGVGVIPEDRRGSGLVMEFSIAENLVLETRNAPPYSNRGLLNRSEIRSHAQALVQSYAISTPDVSLPAYTLSGGNLQRLLLAKILSRTPALLVASQPTAGLDIGATQFIWERLRKERDRGVGILLISSDLNEIMSISDRIACIFGGKIMGVLPRGEADPRKLGLMMGGASQG